ncbi:hypothetical protein, conserved [Eimeria tenella]|uniref:Uncharacterized protein n=1 Tax=Eimeria tenella TaxID=5802 RepID=U6KV29_EIMTE|nr:hypothetical protein, conserved [Eimeria tenella]CDJ41962.1 hypothetical protein, conserved [Eimeria tenella]|eukprot:XP_013232712.1 hypothetical protein, conserved [Eimeria tenella]
MFQQMPPHQQMHPHNQPQVNAPPLLYRENHHDYSTYNSFQPPTPNMPRQHDPQEQAVLASLQYPAWERYENGQSYNCAEHINVDQNNGQYMPQHYYGPSHGPLLGPDEMPCPGPGQLPPGPHQAVGMGGPNNMIHSGHRSHTQQPYHSQHHYHHQQGRGNMPPHMWQPSYHNARPQAGHPYRKGQQHQWQRPPHGQHHQYGRHHYGGQQQRGNKHGGRAANRKAFQFDGTTPAFVPQFQSNRQLELQILSQASADANSNSYSSNTCVNDSPERRPPLDVVARRRQHRKVSSEAQGRRRPGLLPAQRHAAQPTEESSRRNRHLGGCWHSALPCGGQN